ncbi:MAG: hypothetical protein JST88_09300 [Bacteroidetes bacterium]|nr:hypothetical protein [Bacteroidota bacterium]
MKKITLAIDENLLQSLGIANAAAEDTAIAQAIKGAILKAQKADELQNKLDAATIALNQAKQDLDGLKNKVAQDKVEAIISKALEDKKLTAEAANQLKSDYAQNPEGLAKIVNSLSGYTPITTTLTPGADVAANKAALIKEYDEKFMSGELEEIQNANPEHFKALREAKFGKKN